MRSKWTPEDYALKQEVEQATKVNKDALLDHLLNGTPIPQSSSSHGYGGSSSNESASLFSMDYRNNDYMLGTAMQVLGSNGIAAALQADPTLLEKYSANELMAMQKQANGNEQSIPQVSTGPRISQRQWNAIQKYPALIEFLGSDHGEQIANEVAGKVASVMVHTLGENAKKLSKHAYSCESVGKNIKQFFLNKDDGWVCQVTANGPFRGDEALYYNSDQDKSYVLRLRGTEYEDVSDLFNVIHEMAHKGEDDD